MSSDDSGGPARAVLDGQAPRWRRAALMSSLALFATGLAVWSPAATAAGDNPWSIDGVVADPGSVQFADPYGDVKELGAVNQSTAKLNNVHSDVVDTFEFTNPNAQTDLRRVWLGTKKDVNGDTWLYFAWERDANNGSGQVTYEFQLADRPAACDYGLPGDVDMVEPEDPAETALIDGCNPWDNRAPGDFMITWDWSGSSTDVFLREFSGAGKTYSISNDAVVGAEAKFSADKFRGEGAINLTDTVFASKPDSCLTVANIIPGTITGNSDQADYKDIVLADTSGVYISSCGAVDVTKVTNPAGLEGEFDVELDRSGGGPVGYSPDPAGKREATLVDDGGTASFLNLPEGDDYVLTELTPDAPWQLDRIECGATQETAVEGAFEVVAGETTHCWVYNDYPLVPVSATVSGDGVEQEGAGWTLEKIVDVDSWQGELGDDLGTSTWTVTATKTESSTFAADGEIVVTNPNPVPVALSSVSLTLGGAPVTPDCPSLTVPAGGTLTCDWDAEPASAVTALVATIDATDDQFDPAQPSQGSVSWTTAGADLDTVTLEDDLFEHSEDISENTVETFTTDFSCPSDVSVYTEGTYVLEVTNVAELLDGETLLDDDDATVTMTCSLPPALEVTPDAVAGFDRVASWTLDKTVDDGTHAGDAGQTAGSSTWTVTATKTLTDSGYRVEGEVVIDNADDDARTFEEVTVELDDGTPVTVDCPTTTVPAGDSVVCTFEADPEDDSATLATVNVVGDVLPVAETTAEVVWSISESGDDEVVLADERLDVEETIDETTTLTLPETFSCPTDATLYTDGRVYDRTETNTATLTGDETDLEDSATVAVNCTRTVVLSSQPPSPSPTVLPFVAPQQPRVLPFTGTDLLTTMSVGSVLALLGALLVGTARRREADEQ